MKRDVLILTGPTASGKSALAVELAKERGGVVINADSMQLYRDAPILTAQPSETDRDAVPHRLYGILDAGEAGSVAHWLALVCGEIRTAWERGRLPIVTGGTGLYLHALMRGLSPIPDISPQIRGVVREMGTAELHNALRIEDPLMAGHLLPSDGQRMARALEVIRATGESLLHWQKTAGVPPLPEASFTVQALVPERSPLYERINCRALAMMEAGAAAEAAALHARNLPRSLPLLRAVGVRELLGYLDGQATWEEAILRMQLSTRRYAKRQITWIRHHYPDAAAGC